MNKKKEALGCLLYFCREDYFKEPPKKPKTSQRIKAEQSRDLLLVVMFDLALDAAFSEPANTKF